MLAQTSRDICSQRQGGLGRNLGYSGTFGEIVLPCLFNSELKETSITLLPGHDGSEGRSGPQEERLGNTRMFPVVYLTQFQISCSSTASGPSCYLKRFVFLA